MRRLFLAGVLALVGCGGDGGVMDAGPGDEGDAGSGERDAGPAQCPTGQHVCGGGCVDDLPNEPENGCRLGCGEACQVPTGGVATCTSEGTCELGCETPFVLMDDTCVCEPQSCEDIDATCGAPDDGCGTALDCGACEGGAVCIEPGFTCGCAPDDAEPNDSRTDITANIADVPNDSSWSMTLDTWNLDTADDVDWYRFSVTDTGANNPEIRVTLSGQPAGSNYDVAVYYSCDEGSDNSTCTSGSPDDSVGNGCLADSTASSDTAGLDADCQRLGFNDSGTMYIRVTSATWSGGCEPYTLQVDIMN